jgi:aspartate carbamoyltransferase catalytic subunit
MLSVKNIIDIEDLSRKDIDLILENADSFGEVLERDLKKVPVLRGKTIMNLFFEPSTRTRTSFELAAKRLSADLVNFSSSTSSLKKGESIIDTVKTLGSLIIDLLIIRHADSGVMDFIKRNVEIPVINGGDGKHQHPSQALLDVYTIKRKFNSFNGIKVAIVGDIVNSRVARSNMVLFKKMGMDVSVVSAPMLLPENMDYFGGIGLFNSIDEVIEDVDVLYMLRMQFERQDRKYYPSIREYNRYLGLNYERLMKMKKSSIVLHPGPVNRGIEISEEVMNSMEALKDKIKIDEQVKNGLAIRMSLIYLVLAN